MDRLLFELKIKILKGNFACLALRFLLDSFQLNKSTHTDTCKL